MSLTRTGGTASYPVPVTPTPTPWWPWTGLWAGVRARLTRTRTARLRQALDGYTKATQALTLQMETYMKLRDAEQALERVRGWNLALLRDTAALRATMERGAVETQAAHERAVGYLIERDEAHGRIRYLEGELADTGRSRDEMERELKLVLDRCDVLARKLRERKK